MKDFIDIIARYEKQSGGSKLAIGMVVGIEGSSFRRTGIRFLISDDGQWYCGTESGQFYSHLWTKIQAIFVHEQPIVLKLDTGSDDGHTIGVALGYRGIIRLFIQPFKKQQKNHPITVLKTGLSEMNHRILMTVIGTNNCDELQAGDLFLYENKAQLAGQLSKNELINVLDNRAERCWVKGRSALYHIDLSDGSIDVFCEILTHPPQLILFGSQYDVYPLASIAKMIGWRVTVVANPSKLRQSLIETVDKVISLEDTHLLTPDAYTAYILMSHIFERDMAYLQAAIKTNVPYIGMLGPNRRFTRMFDHLAEQGFFLKKEDKKRLFAPMGLNIGAATQEEIAIALLAEVRAFFSARLGGFLKNGEGECS